MEEGLSVEEKEAAALVNAEETPSVPERLRTAPSGVTAGRRLATLTEAQAPLMTRMRGNVELTQTVRTGRPTAHSSDSAEKPLSLGLVGLAKRVLVFGEIFKISKLSKRKNVME